MSLLEMPTTQDSVMQDFLMQDGENSLKSAIRDFMQGFTVETTPGASAKTADYREMLRPGTSVAVTFLPGSEFGDTIKTAARLKREGFTPLPHLAARSIPSQDAFQDYLARLQDEVGIDEVVVLGGSVPTPLGPFDNSMQLLESGLLDRHGIRRIGVAGHPEGSPDIREEDIMAALKWKNAFAERTDAELYIITQFVFQAEPIIAWDRRIQAEGNQLPIRIGVPGLATLKTLLNHARNCGIGASMGFLVKQARNVAKLMSVNAPDKLVLDLAHYKATDPNCGIHSAHMYPLGGLRKTAAWSHAVVDGDFELKSDHSGFTVNRSVE
ncbi:methylenetetrahydrofolate reductase [Fodinicurvata sediminis]|uniref:methylenetetrahydrofolate reductase n=1 Tax=Fodinicurvata sediminis TaxID=1121832 RepID=UPI001B7F7F44|nr:methylenetetrahydrofolate reductase [Fodinicurvata sediminis]